jgi:hypothetical protein
VLVPTRPPDPVMRKRRPRPIPSSACLLANSSQVGCITSETIFRFGQQGEARPFVMSVALPSGANKCEACARPHAVLTKSKQRKDKRGLGPQATTGARIPRSLHPPTGLPWKCKRISSLFHGASTGAR